MLTCRLTVPALFVFSLLAAPAPAQEKVSLKLNLKKGQVFVQAVDVEQKITQQRQGQKLVIDQANGLTTVQTVTDVDGEGVATMELVYESVRWSQHSPLEKHTYDSTRDKTATAPTAKAFAAMVGQTLTMKIKPDGRVTDLTGVDALMSRIIDSMALPPGPAADTAMKQIRRQFGEEAMRQQVEQMTAIYPAGPVGIGDTWKQQVEVNLGAAMIVQTLYTMTGRLDGQAHVKAQGQVSAPQTPALIDAGPMKMKMVLSGKQTGTMAIDEATGVPTMANVDQDLEGAAALINPQGQEVMKVPMTIVSRIKMTTKLK